MEKIYLIMCIILAAITLLTTLGKPIVNTAKEFMMWKSFFNHMNHMMSNMLEVQLLMMNHMIDGNHIEEMKKTRNRLIDMMGDRYEHGNEK